jgi:hypothetical protein
MIRVTRLGHISPAESKILPAPSKRPITPTDTLERGWSQRHLPPIPRARACVSTSIFLASTIAVPAST